MKLRDVLKQFKIVNKKYKTMEMIERYIPQVCSKEFLIVDKIKNKNTSETSEELTYSAVSEIAKKIRKKGATCEYIFIGTQFVYEGEARCVIDSAFIYRAMYIYEFSINGGVKFYVQARCFNEFTKIYRGREDEICINGRNYIVNGKQPNEKLLELFVNEQILEKYIHHYEI